MCLECLETDQDDRVRDEPEDGRCCGGETEAEEDAEVRDALLAHPKEATLLAGRSLLGLLKKSDSVNICYCDTGRGGTLCYSSDCGRCFVYFVLDTVSVRVPKTKHAKHLPQVDERRCTIMKQL